MQALAIRIGTITFGIRIGTSVVVSRVRIKRRFCTHLTQGLYGATFLYMVSLLVLRKQIHLEVYKTVSSENRNQKIAKKKENSG